MGPLTLLRRGRVAIGDPVADIVGGRCVVMLIGERPGLSAPDSMGAYLTWAPTAQTRDADRNCISNIRPAGVGYAEAARRLSHLLTAIFERRQSGIAIKDRSAEPRPIGA
jgi:ethanolamine ammonia-lyase small subunit